MDITDNLTRWTARATFALYALALAVGINAGSRKSRLQTARFWWTAACALMLLHVGLAFARVHHWSHSAAYQDTARQTADLFGLNWGGGLYANYALLLVWLADVCWCCAAGISYQRRPKSLTWAVQGFLAFMWFNATVVFGHGGFRWAALGAFIILAWMGGATRAWSKNKTASAGSQRKQSKGD